MAYDEELAFRIRALLADESGVDERAMFGGLAFLINGNMAMAASRNEGVLVRVAPTDAEKLLELDHVERMVMGGRKLRGWLLVAVPGIRTDRQLKRWVSLAADFARKLPPK